MALYRVPAKVILLIDIEDVDCEGCGMKFYVRPSAYTPHTNKPWPKECPRCVKGLPPTAVPENGFKPAETKSQVEMLAATGADICRHAARYLRGEHQPHYGETVLQVDWTSVNLLMDRHYDLCGILSFSWEAAKFGE